MDVPLPSFVTLDDLPFLNRDTHGDCYSLKDFVSEPSWWLPVLTARYKELVMTTAIAAEPMSANFTATPNSSLRPVLLTVLSLKLAVAAFLLLSVSLSPPLSAESRYLAGDAQLAAAN